MKNIVVTIHLEDGESESIWKNLLGENLTIIKLGKPNFWEIGDGPCGPCTELYYDRGKEYDPDHKGLDLIREGENNQRYIEIWNIVFSQYWKQGDSYQELATKNIDTGAGLERILTILERKENLFHNSIFSPLIQGIEQFTKARYFENSSFSLKPHFQVAADHIRTASIILSERVVPDNKGRGYVVRKLLRRAFVALYILDANPVESIVTLLSQITVKTLLPIYPNLTENLVELQDRMLREYSLFFKILRGMEGKMEKRVKSKSISIEKEMFTLVEREGIPLPLIEKYLEDRRIKFSKEKVQILFENHRQKSKNDMFSSAFDFSN